MNRVYGGGQENHENYHSRNRCIPVNRFARRMNEVTVLYTRGYDMDVYCLSNVGLAHAS